MRRAILALLLFSLFGFSSCLYHSTTDVKTDEALGLSAESDSTSAQQDLERTQKNQIEEQKHQLDRLITDPAIQNTHS